MDAVIQDLKRELSRKVVPALAEHGLAETVKATAADTDEDGYRPACG